MLLLSIFAGFALLLSIVGIYGTMAYVVTQRTREMGIRLAMGAQAGDVFQLVLRQGGKLALAGVAGGVVAALALTRLMTSLLFAVSAADPVTFARVAILLTLVAIAACYLPARTSDACRSRNRAAL
jgi:ABC-type antimicrobial peptide transport system permease subunit